MRSLLLSVALLAQLSASAQSAQDSLMPWKKYDYVSDYFYQGFRRVTKEGKHGLVDRNWKEVILSRYDNDMYVDEGYANVFRDGKAGLADTFGNEIIPCIYDKVYYYSLDVSQRGPGFHVIKDGKHGIVDHRGSELVPAIYDELETISDTRIIVAIESVRGLVDFNNKQILPLRFRRIEPDHESTFYITRDSSRVWAAFDSSGQFIDGGYDRMEYYNRYAILVKCDGKWGLIDARGRKILPTAYDSIKTNYRRDNIEVEKDGKWGMADENGNLLVPCVYDKLKFIDKKAYAAVDSGKWKIFSDKGAYQLEHEYRDFGRVNNDGILWVECSRGFGYINLYGKELIPCTLSYPTSFHKDSLKAFSTPGTTPPAHVNSDSKLTKEYEYPGGFSQGRAIIKDSVEHYGFINRKGKIVIAPRYQDAKNFHSGLAAVKRDGRYGYIDTNGHVVVDFIYDRAEDFNEGLAAVEKSGRYGYINTKGKTVIPFVYEEAMRFHNGKATVANDSAWGMIDKKGKVVIPFYYDWPFQFSEGLAAVSFSGKRFFIDPKGRTAIGDSMEFYGSFFNGMASVGNDTGYGYINRAGKLVIPLIFGSRDSWFTNSVATVHSIQKSDHDDPPKHGVINNKGDTVVPFIYTWIYGFDKSGGGIVEQYGRFSFIDTSGKFLTPFLYEGIAGSEEFVDLFTHPLIATKIKGKWGYSNYLGRTVIPHKYDKATHFSEGLAAIQLGDKWGYIDETGKEVMWIELPK